MLAATFMEKGRPLVIAEVADPVLAPGQLLLRVSHCGVCGTDLHLTDPDGDRTPACGSILGHEFSGHIVEVGPDCGDLSEGDHVAAMPFMGCGTCSACLTGQIIWCERVRSQVSGVVPGAFAEYVSVAARSTICVPPSLSEIQAALIEPVAVAVHAAKIACSESGANALILGAGPIGLATAAVLRARGAGSIVMAARSSRSEERALAAGADAFLMTEGELGSAYRSITGESPSLVFECAGFAGALHLSIKCAGARSTIVSLGACMTRESLLSVGALAKELRILFSRAYDLADFREASELLAARPELFAGLVTDVVGFADFPAAFESLRSPNNLCKLLLRPHA